MAVLGYLPKLKTDLGLAFGAHFLHEFCHKNVFYLILYQWTNFQYYSFFRSQDIKRNVLLRVLTKVRNHLKQSKTT